jgi:hypothetical protein
VRNEKLELQNRCFYALMGLDTESTHANPANVAFNRHQGTLMNKFLFLRLHLRHFLVKSPVLVHLNCETGVKYES